MRAPRHADVLAPVDRRAARGSLPATDCGAEARGRSVPTPGRPPSRRTAAHVPPSSRRPARAASAETSAGARARSPPARPLSRASARSILPGRCDRARRPRARRRAPRPPHGETRAARPPYCGRPGSRSSRLRPPHAARRRRAAPTCRHRRAHGRKGGKTALIRRSGHRGTGRAHARGPTTGAGRQPRDDPRGVETVLWCVSSLA